MTNCRQLSDRMPDTAHGSVRWTIAEERHLARCEDCRREWDLVRRVARLGMNVDLGVDPAAVADRVLGRLRTAKVSSSRRRVWAVGVLAAAASLVLVLWGRVPIGPSRTVAVTRESLPVAPQAAPLRLPVPELEGLNAEQLRSVMESLDQPFRADEVLESSGWGDLESRDLEAGFSS